MDTVDENYQFKELIEDKLPQILFFIGLFLEVSSSSSETSGVIPSLDIKNIVAFI